MRQLFKLHQVWLGIAILLLSVSLGLGLPMIISATPSNGILIIIIGVAISVPFFLRAYKLSRRQKSIPQSLIFEQGNVHNQRIRKLRQSLDELFYDARTKRPTETEYQTTEYQTRIKNCRKLATNTGNSMAIEHTTAILNLIHLYVRRVQQALKETNADFHIEVIDSTFSEQINTELGLLLNEVQKGER